MAPRGRPRRNTRQNPNEGDKEERQSHHEEERHSHHEEEEQQSHQEEEQQSTVNIPVVPPELQNLIQAVVTSVLQQHFNGNGTTNGTNDRSMVRDFQQQRPPYFKGREGAVEAENWLKKISQILTLLNITSHAHKILLATSQLIDDAGTWWEVIEKQRTLIPEGERTAMTWEQFSATFLEHYFPEEEKERQTQAFLSLVQGTMTVAEYHQEFLSLSVYALYMVDTEYRRARKFEWGLRPNIRAEVTIFKAATLAEVVSRATIAEQEMAELMRFDNRRAQSGRGTFQPNKRFRPNSSRPSPSTGSIGGFRPNHPSTSASVTQAPRGVSNCFHCDQPGHFKRECPQLNKPSYSRGSSRPPVRPTNSRGGRTVNQAGRPPTGSGRLFTLAPPAAEDHSVIPAIAPCLNCENGETATQAGNELDKLYRARRETLDVLQQCARNQKSTPSSIASQESKTMTMQYVDDFYFSALLDEDLFPISDEKYAEELQFQEVLTSSVLSRLPHQPVLSRAPSTGPSTSNLKRIRMETGKSSRTICSEKLTSSVLSCPPHQSVQSHAPSSRRSTRILKRSRMETGQSSRTICGICMEEKSMVEMFRTITCSHVFCSDCISKHVAAKIQENIAEVKCPGVNCRGVLEPEICRSIVPKEVFDRWEDALSESAVLASQRFYCPFKDCSALLVDDCEETIRESECPNCRRMFCAQCRVSWHSGVSCEEYQRLNEYERGREDLTLMELAKTKKWKRCPRCKYFVEKTQGCLHITCRCGFQFCYGCGLTWSDVHSSCGSN